MNSGRNGIVVLAGMAVAPATAVLIVPSGAGAQFLHRPAGRVRAT